MLSARDLTLRRGPEPLVEQVNFTLFRGNKVGLTGANGAGKSSLFAAILGELGPDQGGIDRPAGLKVAHVEQEVTATDRAAIEFVLDGDIELRSVMAAIEDAERRDAAMELAELYASLQAIDGYRARARAAALMHGLGFKSTDLERKVAEFSGGWRVRLAMARALGMPVLVNDPPLERAGGGERGAITGLFTVLVEGDDMNDPIADSVRSILDGHIVLTRELATQNHYPAIDVLESVSRLNRDLLPPEKVKLTADGREYLAVYRKNQDLINIGAYPAGSSQPIDQAIALHLPLNHFLRQNVTEGFPAAQSWDLLGQTLKPKG